MTKLMNGSVRLHQMLKRLKNMNEKNSVKGKKKKLLIKNLASKKLKKLEQKQLKRLPMWEVCLGVCLEVCPEVWGAWEVFLVTPSFWKACQTLKLLQHLKTLLVIQPI